MRPAAISSVLVVATLAVGVAIGASGAGCQSASDAPQGDDAAGDGAATAEGGSRSEASSDVAAQSDDGGNAVDDASDAGLYPVPVVAGVRFAVWSTQALPAVDFCLAPHGTTMFLGPMMYQAVAALGGPPDAGGDEAGIVRGLVFPQMSAYVPVPPGQYDLRVVAAGSPSCPYGVIPDVTDLPPLPRDATLTLALFDKGQGASGFTVASFVDDVSSALTSYFVEAGTPEGGGDAGTGAPDGGDTAADGGPALPPTMYGRTLVRFLNATAREPSADLMLVQTLPPSTLLLFEGVGYGQRSTVAAAPSVATAVDDAGYVNLASLGEPAAYYARRTQDQTLLGRASNLQLPPGDVVTFVLVPATSLSAIGTGDAGEGGANGPPLDQLLVCVDNSAGPGDLSTCVFGQ